MTVLSLSCNPSGSKDQMTVFIGRREFITLLGGAAAAWPVATQAQQRSGTPVLGFLGSATPQLWADRLRAFHQGLNESGYFEGRNVKIEYRWAEDQNTRFTSLAEDLTRSGVDVIAGCSFGAALAAKAVTATVPIVFAFAGDGGSLTEMYRLNGLYAGRILNGERPADLPVQQSTKIDLIINLKSANALGLTVPLPLLGRADEVIE
jgi:ABC-type uncharacterized transport system substrate-binding protein